MHVRALALALLIGALSYGAVTRLRHFVALAQFEIQHVYYSDFGRFHYSTARFLAGRSMYVPVPDEYRAPGQELRQRTDLTPPHAHLVMLPVAWLPLPRALVVWIALNLVALWWCARVIARTLDLRPITPLGWLIVTLATIASVPFGSWMITGQVVIIYGVAVVAAWRASRLDQWGRAGAWLGVLWSMKPFLGVFAVYLLFTRRWRALASATAASAVSLAVGLALWGVAEHAGWIEHLGRVTWAAHPRNSALLGFWQRTLDADPDPARVAWLLSAVAVTALATLAIRRSPSIDRHWLVLLAAALLLSPLGWVYYWWWLVPPCIALWFGDRGLRRPLFLAGAATAWWPWEWTAHSSPLGAATVGSVYCVGLLLLLWSCTGPSAAVRAGTFEVRPS